MRKVVVYAGTRNVYGMMAVAAKSLLWNTPIDAVWFLIEDDEFPEKLPEKVHVMNVKGQQIFPESGPNYSTKWTYMSLLRCALAKLFPEEDLILWLDVDTIVDADISRLFCADLTTNCLAGCPEPAKSLGIFRYVNAGVLLFNLDLIRRLGKDDEMIRLINGRKMSYPDQDAINLLFQGYITQISGDWNASDWTERGATRKIIHYAAKAGRENEPEFRKYAGMGWPG